MSTEQLGDVAARSSSFSSLQLWPGFVTSILQYEEEVLLMTDVVHKILRTDTVLDIMADIYNANRNRFQEVATRKLVGEIVLTR